MRTRAATDIGLHQCVRFGPKVGQTSNKQDKSRTFSDQIPVQFGSESQNILKYELKKSDIFPICSQPDPLWTLI